MVSLITLAINNYQTAKNFVLFIVGIFIFHVKTIIFLRKSLETSLLNNKFANVMKGTFTILFYQSKVGLK